MNHDKSCNENSIVFKIQNDSNVFNMHNQCEEHCPFIPFSELGICSLSLGSIGAPPGHCGSAMSLSPKHAMDDEVRSSKRDSVYIVQSYVELHNT
jgi:hypothetical protein